MKTEQWERGCDIKERVRNLESAIKSLEDVSFVLDKDGIYKFFRELEVINDPRFKVDVIIPPWGPVLSQFRQDCIKIMEKRAAELRAEFEAL